MKKDPYKNIDPHRDARPGRQNYDDMANKWAVGTKKATVTKIDTRTGAMDRSKIVSQVMPRSTTDHLSFDPPANDRPF
jgi:hypothetical protein